MYRYRYRYRNMFKKQERTGRQTRITSLRLLAQITSKGRYHHFDIVTIKTATRHPARISQTPLTMGNVEDILTDATAAEHICRTKIWTKTTSSTSLRR